MKEIRPKEDKAVSPIIATILLIAITVVLAATLVTILGGFTHGAGNTVEAAGATPSLSGNGTTITLNVASSSQTLNNSLISFVITVNSTHTLSGTLSDYKVSNSGYYVILTSSSSLFDGGSSYTFHVVHNVKSNLGVISSYSITLSYKGTQFYSSGTQTS